MRIVEEGIGVLSEYGAIPISFEVKTKLDVQVLNGGLGGVIFSEQTLTIPYVKDYDGLNGEGPARWAKRWDIRNWTVLSAFVDDRRVGGCAIAFDTKGVTMLEDRNDLAVLWDLRVHPDFRRTGIGERLFGAAAAWATNRGCRYLKVETQNNNVPACRFYAKQGCVLGALNRFAYEEFPDEVELIWYKELR
ncbi:MAG: GNAT family N-acetyltransferase [Candidatus Hydrogenedentes bacterium]|nr:GNAT family N-acetyltransferase [Candidatus Hydrogenedentota bacterium]